MTRSFFLASAFSFVVAASLASVGCASQTEPTGESEDQTTEAQRNGHRPHHPCIDNVACLQGAHWDADVCSCVATAIDAGAPHCVQHAFCVIGKHWDPNTCACVSAAVDAGPPYCVQNVQCTTSGHWDPASCRCVANCVDNVACVVGSHWDPVACTCVVNP